MAYLRCFLLSFFFFYFWEGKYTHNPNSVVKNNLHAGLLILPCIYWILFLGLQDNVGTDYPSYFSFFSTGNTQIFLSHKEYGFALLVYLAKNIGLSPQVGFIFVSCIQVIFFAIFLYKFNFERLDIFLFIYFVCSSAFIFQMNTLRQYIAMNIFMVALLYMYKKKFFAFLLFVLFGTFMHISCILLLPIYFLNLICHKNNEKLLYLELFIGAIVCIIGIDSLVTKFVAYTPYAYYLRTEYFLEQNRKSLATILSKLVFFPFYILLIKRNRSYIWNKYDLYYIHLGIISYAIKIGSMSSFFLSRYGTYFDIIAFFPLYYYFLQLIKNRSSKKYMRIFELFIFLCVTLGTYAIRIIVFPKNEYIYKSIVLNWI